MKYTRFNGDGNAGRTSFNKERTGRTQLFATNEDSAAIRSKEWKKGSGHCVE